LYFAGIRPAFISFVSFCKEFRVVSHLRAFSHPKRATCSPLFKNPPRGVCTERSGTIPYLKIVFSLYKQFKDDQTRRFHFGNSFWKRASSNHTANPFYFLADAARHPRARFPSSGCPPQHAIGRRGDELAMSSPRRRATRLRRSSLRSRFGGVGGYGGQAHLRPSNFSQKAKFFCNLAPPFPY
jgi:hypothetical protein